MVAAAAETSLKFFNHPRDDYDFFEKTGGGGCSAARLTPLITSLVHAVILKSSKNICESLSMLRNDFLAKRLF